MSNLVIDLLNLLKSYGPFGVFFVMWFIDKKFTHGETERRSEEFRSELTALKEEIKEQGRKWYELGQRACNQNMKEGMSL